MDSFEAVVSMLLRHQGYWTIPSFKVDLSKKEKVAIGRPSAPRWEIDLLAFKGSTNEVLAVECKSYLNSNGVRFGDGRFEPANTYKLFSEDRLRAMVLGALKRDLVKGGFCMPRVKVQLCLAVGKFHPKTDRDELNAYFRKRGWRCFDPAWIRNQLREASQARYENDIAFVVSKMLLKMDRVEKGIEESAEQEPD